MVAMHRKLVLVGSSPHMVEMTGLHITLDFLQLGRLSSNGGHALKAGFGGVLPTHGGDDWPPRDAELPAVGLL